MLNLNEMHWYPIDSESDAYELETNNGMPIEVMMNIMSHWNWQKSVLRVYDVMFENNHPHYVKIVGFTDFNDRDKEEFIEFIFNVSLTHKVMFVDKDGRIFITKSDDGQTNIDADLIEDMLNAYVEDKGG